jgi:hypothetical protein
MYYIDFQIFKMRAARGFFSHRGKIEGKICLAAEIDD